MEETKKLRVLVIDDELGIREGCRKILTSEGYEVETAENGLVGLRLLRERRDIHVVLVDLKMPGMDGMEVVTQITREQLAPKMIIMTAYPTIPSAVKGIKLGASDYIEKPFTPDELCLAIANVLEEQKLPEPRGKTAENTEKDVLVSILTRVTKDPDFLEHASERLMEYHVSPAQKIVLMYVSGAAREDVSSYFASELKNDYASISSLARTMGEPHVTRGQEKDVLSKIVIRAEHALDKIEEQLTLSRIRAGELQLDRRRVHFYQEIIQIVLHNQHEVLAKTGMNVSVDIPEELTIVCDPEYLRIVYNALLNNAIKYGTPASNMYLGYSGLQSGYHYFNVAHEGKWIAEDARKKIFEQYPDLEQKSPAPGLYASMEILRKHGGDIWVEPCFFVDGRYIAGQIPMKNLDGTSQPGNNFIIRLHRIVL